MTRQRVLITGDLGFVGQAFRQVAIDRGWDAYGCDIKRGAHEDARKLFAGDHTTQPHFDLVIHCAAIVGGRATIEGEPLKVASDLAIDSDLFQWALRARPRRIVYFSSSAAYPVYLQTAWEHRKMDEDDIRLDDVQTPDMTYGWAKLTGELLALYAQQEGLRVHVFRPFSGYGETQDLDYPFPSFIDRARREDNPFVIWGSGTQTRDFIHVDDIVGAVLAAIEADVPGPVNLGWGRPTSFNELAAMVCAEAGYQPDFVHLLDKPIGVFYRVCDPTKMLSFYTPTVTLEEGIRRALG